MKIVSRAYLTYILILFSIAFVAGGSGCANIIPPTGGPRDSLPPVLVMSVPKDSVTNFRGDRITLNFDEYVEVQNVFENVIVSPTPNNIPLINYRFRTVSIRLKDTLEANTTYSINFGNSIKDINEGNVFKEFTYVFSTGNTLDQNTIAGRVVMAETGKVDTTLIVVLHRNLDDSAVSKEKPRYIAKLDGKGNFQFRNLPAGNFAMYAIPNEYSRHYDDTTKPFAFADSAINAANNSPVTLYAYTLTRVDTATKPKPAAINVKENNRNSDREKLLRFQPNLDNGRQDLLKNLELTFNRQIVTYDSSKIVLATKNLTPLTNYTIRRDTGNRRLIISHNWPPQTEFKLVVDTSAVADSAGVNLAKNDTITFTTKGPEDYGSVRLIFKNLDFTKNPVLQLVQSDKVVDSSAITQRDWYRKLFEPGEYELRILYDTNKNGKWDPGKFFGSHVQPERVISLATKLAVRGNWDNEKEITL
jgi:hypothetical protein